MNEHVSEYGDVAAGGKLVAVELDGERGAGAFEIDDGLRSAAEKKHEGEDGEAEEQKESGGVGEAPGGDGHGKPACGTLWVNSAAGLPGCVEALTAARDRSADEQAS